MKYTRLINTALFFIFISVPNAIHAADDPEITSAEIKNHISYLASDELEGRYTGTPACSLVADYIKQQFESSNLSPLFNGSYIQEFPFVDGLRLTKNNSFIIINNTSRELKPEVEFTPAPFSGTSKIEADIVFAGYGISAPKLNYDDYAGIDVKDKIVLVLRYSPEHDSPHSQFDEFSSFRYKASVAKDKGAAGIIYVNGYLPEDDEDKLMELKFDRGGAVKNFSAVHIKRDVADYLFKSEKINLKEYQRKIDSTKSPLSFQFKNSRIKLSTEVEEITKTSWNVAGILTGSDPQLKDEYIIIGAHYDHLGWGQEGSLYRGTEPMIHNGADDNASGTTGVIELAEKFLSVKDKIKRSIIFLAVSGEELGLLGSTYFVNNPPVQLKKVVTMINMDMIGRLNDEKELIIYGTATSPKWKDLLNSKNSYNFKLALNDEGYGPSDHSSFYGKEIPVLFFFTGTHSDYHRPSDDVDNINFSGQENILNFVYNTAFEICNYYERPAYVNVPRKDSGTMGGWKVYVGTIPDYASTSEGFKISGVTEGSPAQKAGLKGGDIMISFGGKAITNIYDYVYALKEFVPGDNVDVELMRNNEKIKVNITLGAR